MLFRSFTPAKPLGAGGAKKQLFEKPPPAAALKEGTGGAGEPAPAAKCDPASIGYWNFEAEEAASKKRGSGSGKGKQNLK